jgi:hypothetical protein
VTTCSVSAEARRPFFLPLHSANTQHTEQLNRIKNSNTISMSSSPTTITNPPVRVQPKRTTSNLGTRRDKFLRSLGIPSFQHAISHKPTPYTSTGVTLERPPSEGLRSSVSTPLVSNLDKDKTRAVTTMLDKTKGDEDRGVEDLLASLDTDKRMSSIRLRNYKSIGNLDQQAREDGLTGSIRGPGGKQFEMAGGMTVSKSMPLIVHNQIQNEEMEGGSLRF